MDTTAAVTTYASHGADVTTDGLAIFVEQVKYAAKIAIRHWDAAESYERTGFDVTRNRRNSYRHSLDDLIDVIAKGHGVPEADVEAAINATANIVNPAADSRGVRSWR
jgi:hypothetical protein